MGFPRSFWTKGVPLSVGVIVGALGLAVLLGWYEHWIPVMEVVPGLPPMLGMTALGFFVSGLGVFLAGLDHPRATVVCALIVMVGSGLVCLEYLLNVSFGIDQFLGPDYINVHATHPGRMSPATAFCFLLISIVLLAISSHRTVRYASALGGILASVLVAAGTVGVLSYVLKRADSNEWRDLSMMALHTAMGFVLMGAGLLSLAWTRKFAKAAPEWLAWSLGLGLAVGVLGVWHALMVHEKSQLPLLSGIIMGGGVLGALLVAVAIDQALKARQRSRELQEGKDLMEGVFEAPPDTLLLVDRQGQIVRVNGRVEAMFGYAPHELLGAPVEILVPPDLRAHERQHRETYFASPRPQQIGTGMDLHACRKDGSKFPVEISLGPVHSGGATQVVALVRDVSERRRAEEALRLSEERFRNIFEQGPLGLTLVRRDGRMLRVNPAFCRMLGYSEEELTAVTPVDITHPDDRGLTVDMMESIFTGEAFVHRKIEKRYVKKSGEIIWGSLSATAIRDGKGSPLFALGMVEDITERKRAEAKLRLGNEIIANVEEGLCLVRTSDSTIVYANPKFEKMFGYGPAELTGEHIAIINAANRRSPQEKAQEITLELTRHGVWRGEVRNRKKDGSTFVTATTASTFDHPEFGKVWISIHKDVTRQKEAERKLKEQAALLNLAQDAIIVRDLENRITFWNRGAEDTYGWRTNQALGHNVYDLLQTRFPIPASKVETALETRGTWEGELEQVARDGRTLVTASRWSLQRNERGTPIAVMQINRDITLRKRDEERWRNLMERLSLATRTASIGIWDWDLRTNLTVWDDTIFKMTGIPKMVPMPYSEFSRRIHPDDVAAVDEFLLSTIGGKARDFLEFRMIRPDGTVRHLSSAAGVVRDGQGNVVRVVGTAVDMTARKEMEAQIEASREQMATSARLSALGMMAGGVAHEINNPLAIIHASAADLLDRIDEEGAVPPAIVARNSRRILETAERIKRIINSMRLLAREGSQDPLRPASLARIVEGTLEVCKERFKHHSVDLRLPAVDPALLVSCREVQIGQVLLNLLQNAFDAVIEQPGEKWVRVDVTVADSSVELAVTDSGPGIPPELRPKIMEPFFTTKEVGKGTGLGLSLSQSIVEEHGSKLELTDRGHHPCFSFRLALSRKEEHVCN